MLSARRGGHASLAVAAALVLGVEAAHAAVVKYTFTGTVVSENTTSVFSSLIGQSFTYVAEVDGQHDSEFAGGSNPSTSNTFHYSGSFEFSVGGYAGTGTSNRAIALQNDVPQSDGTLVDSFTGGGGGGQYSDFTRDPTFGSYETTSVSVRLTDNAGIALSSYLLPAAIDVADFQDRIMRLFLNPDSGGVHRINARLDAVQVAFVSEPSVVPVPAPAGLLAAALASLALLGQRRRAGGAPVRSGCLSTRSDLRGP